MTTTQTTIRKLPAIKEDVQGMKNRIQDLEREVVNYKNRLEELRKAKNNLIIKKTTEYVKTGAPAIGLPREARGSIDSSSQGINDSPPPQSEAVRAQNEELEKTIENLTNELTEAKNLIAALRIENEEAKGLLETTKREFQIELAQAYAKQEESKREIKQWEQMYKEWMTMMEDRVSNINRTHQILQQCLNPNENGPQQGAPN